MYLEPTLCFQSYVAKRSKSIAAEHGEVTWHGRIIPWLFRKMISLSVPPNSADMTDALVEEAMDDIPQDRIFDTAKCMKKWRGAWITDLSTFRNLLVSELLLKGFDIGQSFEWYYCLYHSKDQQSQKFRHCWACLECRETDSWHCGGCNKCVHSFKVRCPGCGGVSEDFGKDRREAGVRKDF